MGRFTASLALVGLKSLWILRDLTVPAASVVGQAMGMGRRPRYVTTIEELVVTVE